MRELFDVRELSDRVRDGDPMEWIFSESVFTYDDPWSTGNSGVFPSNSTHDNRVKGSTCLAPNPSEETDS